MKTLIAEQRPKAIERIIQSMQAADPREGWNGGNLSEVFGWDGTALSPISRAAFVEQFGAAITDELEAEARAKLDELQQFGEHYRAHAAAADANAAKVAGELSAGDFVWTLDCGYKCDHQDLAQQVAHFVEGEADDADAGRPDEYKRVNRRLVKIERVVDVADLAAALQAWQPAKRADGEGYEGGSASDDVDDDWRPYDSNELEAERRAKLATFYTVGVLARDPSGAWYIVAAAGYSYPRYVLLPTDYREMFAPIVAAFVARRELERLQAEEAATMPEARQ